MMRRGCGDSGTDGEAVPRRQRAVGRRWVAQRIFARAFLLRQAASPYALSEVQRNLDKLPASAATEWPRLRPLMTVVDDVVSLDRPVIFGASKDRPILFTALAWAHVLLTLDKADFAEMLGGTFYGMSVLLPYEFLDQERAAGRLAVAT